MPALQPCRWPYLLMLAAAIATGYGAGAWQRYRSPAKSFGVGIVTWIGYAPIYIARDKGFFQEEGIDVDVMILDGIDARKNAYENGQLDFLPDTPDAFVILFSGGEPRDSGRLVAALDESSGADGLVAKAEIKSIGELRGKRVGFQEGITSQFLLLYFLKGAGLSGRDIKSVPLSAAAAASAFRSGSIDAAVTWEPWLSDALQTSNAELLATSATTPGLIVDVLFASGRALDNHARPLKAFMRSWYRGVNFMQTEPEQAQELIAKDLGASKPEVQKMLKTTRFYSSEGSTQYLRLNLPGIIHDANELYVANGVVRTEADISQLINYSLLAPHSESGGDVPLH